ncbi:hypothetical protein [Polaribacter porphyrae]|uniref:Uncharacterized protein n=1 Tax=Polaribacter porphyrae TaxID=1137780 RepID=A0A2S7WKT2_9FLAO|nr:hypothetical protein [Polaribacter porphyrae]PQJ78199.1 hypothetical protein BTO18_02885 [Polaribacter porphyrae]
MNYLEEPYIKLLFLILPAIFFVLKFFLIPILENLKFKRSLIGKSVTLNIFVKDSNKTHVVKGKIKEIIDDNYIILKRKNHPNFRFNYLLSKFKFAIYDNCDTDFYIDLLILEDDYFDMNSGFKKV